MTKEIKELKNIGILLIIVIGVSALYYSTTKNTPTNVSLVATTTDDTIIATAKNTKTISTATPVITKIKDAYPSSYANGEYFFKISFPSYVKPQNYFTTFYNLASNWRINSSYANQGKLIIALPIYRVDQGQYTSAKSTYPLYFTAEVRISSSLNTAKCYAIDTGYKADGSTTINGVTFKKFNYNDNQTPNYTAGESYRTIHDSKCFVLEQIKSGSNIKTDTMTIETPDATLNAYYNVGESIIKTFKFTK